MATPHRVVTSVVDSVVSGVQGVGEEISSGLDAPFRDIGLPTPAPHRAIDRLFDGGANTFRTAVGGVASALDVLPEAIGFPPDLGGGRGGRIGLPDLPWD